MMTDVDDDGVAPVGAQQEAFDTVLAEVYRREAGRCTATLVRLLGDVDLAEDAVADAFAVAAARWRDDGVPPNPGGWITTTARNRAIDHLRRESTRTDRYVAAYRMTDPTSDPTPGTAALLGDVDVVPDDQLRLMFLCCHPSLAPDAQVALTLRLLGGLETTEIARAFLVPDSTMAQRIVRAKRKVRVDRVGYRLPAAHELAERLGPVRAVVYLVFNEGHTASAGAELTRPDLSGEAIRLGRVLVELLPGDHESRGLLALMVLTEARRPSRTDASGNLVRLADQDRSRWDAELIAEGRDLVRSCLAADRLGPYQVQAAIAAVHGAARTAEDTDWSEILALYDRLLVMRPDAIVALNRAIALAEVDGPAAALAALDDVDLASYHLFHATRAEYLTRLGRGAEAASAYERAAALTDNVVEQRHYARRRTALADG